MLVKLRRYFIPPNIQGQENLRKAGLLVFGLIVVVAAAFVYLSATLILGLPRGITIMSLLLVSILFLLLLFKSGKLTYRITSNLFLGASTTAIVFAVFFDGGIYSSILDWLALTAVGAIILLSKREAILWMLLVCLIVFSFSFLNYQDIATNKDVPKSVYPVFISVTTLGLILAFFFMIQYFEDTIIHSMNEISSQKMQIEREQERSDELLLNILPKEIMQELKATGKTPAHRYEQVSVIFADFKDFSKISSTLTPEVLVEALEDYFEAFDHIIDAYDIEKIKTVGDAYICASGIPSPNTNNAFIAVEVSYKILDVIEEYKIRRKDKVNFDIRIGIHTGPVVAGVVGITKFAYDIWGDTVNTAARMQENGEPNRINISQSTYDIVKEKYHCTHRGKIAAKNKGDIDMYFISEPATGSSPQ
jgi:class 3 adenylate cyclase